jgi:hypothetical protein
MNEEKKYFGMTNIQIGILAGLAGVLILIVCLGGWLVLGNATSKLSAQPPTQTLEPTVTPARATLVPTVTPTMAPTPIPYEQLIPTDWKQFKTALVEIWMPANFRLADKKTKNNIAGFNVSELMITEIPSKSSVYNVVVVVAYDLLAGDSLDAHLDAKIATLPQTSRVTDRRTVFVNSVEARKIIIETRENNVDNNELLYAFLDGNTVWFVAYATEISKFFENLPTFEQSIKTFRVVR